MNLQKFISLILSTVFITVLFSCEEIHIKKIDKNKIPTKEILNFKISYLDSGMVKLKIKAPKLIEYKTKDVDYTEFPKGIEVFMFKKQKYAGYFKSDYAVINNKDSLVYEARGNVLIISEKKDTIKTEKVFWNKKKKIFYNTDKTTITDINGNTITSKYGFWAKENFYMYKLLNSNGIIQLEDEKTKSK